MEYSIRPAQAADAGRIVALIRAAYGEGYADRAFLNRRAVAQQLRTRAVLYALAFDRTGRHVGQTALQRLNEAGLFEHCKAVVLPEHQGRGLMGAMSAPLLREIAPAAGARLILGRAVTTHPFTQRCTRSAGYSPLGLLLGHWPAHAIAGPPAPTQAVSALAEGLRIERRPAPRGLTLRGADLERARLLLAGLGVAAAATSARGYFRPLRVVRQEDAVLGLRHLRWSDAGPLGPLGEGADVARARASGGAGGEEPRLTWADVPAEHPDAAELVARLRGEGFGFAAYLPLAGWAGEDVLRLQRLAATVELDREAICVLPHAVPVRDDVYADWPGAKVTA